MSVGKRVVDDLYIHLSAIESVTETDQRARIRAALARLPDSKPLSPNVVKLNLRSQRIALLAYPEFDTDPFPALAASWSFPDGPGAGATFRQYASSLNPPILHRKELLVAADHPRAAAWRELTAIAKSLGLFDDPTTIGFRLNWQRAIEAKGYQLSDGTFTPIGNESDEVGASALSGLPIQRHLTALSRTALSAPAQLLVRHGLLRTDKSFFDYGCGRGGDIACLKENGFDASGWDPHFAPHLPQIPAAIVNLGFVINVIEDPAERVDALIKAFSLTREVLAVGVMLHSSSSVGRPFGDGLVTSRNTFQKYFTQGEIKAYIEDALHKDVAMVGPGIGFVFVDQEIEQRFAAGQYRSHGVAARLQGLRSVPRPLRVAKAVTARAPKSSGALELSDDARRALGCLWATCLDLGRFPEPDEVESITDIDTHLGGLRKGIRRAVQFFDQSLLEVAAQTRADDLKLFLAAQRFAKRRAYGALEARLQRDIRQFFGSYAAAQQAGLQLLIEAANPSLLLSACQHAAADGLGYLIGSNHSLQLHISLVERLPAVLRAFVACGLMLWDATSDVQLIKIHIDSGKLTLLEFDNFDEGPLPLLRRRIKVNIRKLDYEVFEYGTEAYPMPHLYWKSRYLNEDYPGYAEQLAFDEALEVSGALSVSAAGLAPYALQSYLTRYRLEIVGMELKRSDSIPSLDHPCGRFLTFRNLIECGETRERLGISNLPKQVASYNALFDLASEVLDPVIEYFGGIRLTYGLCSTELQRHIKKRVAPELDQHAAAEVRRTGKPICERGGAACDFLVDDEDMEEVAEWIIANTPFDRLYFYGKDRPIHVSYASAPNRLPYRMKETASGRVVPERFIRSKKR